MISDFIKANPGLARVLGIVLVIGAAIGFYFIAQEYRKDSGDQVAALPQAEKSDLVAVGDQASGQQAETAPKADAAPEQQQPAAGLVDPRFDVLRVEKDGSTVIAGSGPANSTIDVVSGGQVIASAKSDASGDFAIVLDNPLAAGDHELSIRATGENGAAITSAETGIVHVPEKGANDEVIAMVAKQGEASRVLQSPDTAGTEAKTAETQESPAAGTESAQAPVVKPAEASPETGGEQVASAQPAPDATAEQPAAEQQSSEQPATVEPAVVAPVLVKAVDVDGGKIFIAGSGEPGRKINVYVDGKFLGVTEVGPEGGFLLETTGDIAAGSHEIRADMLADGSAEVTNRAVVPLVHQPQEVAAAQEPAGAGAQQSDASEQQVASEEQPVSDSVEPKTEESTAMAARENQPAAAGTSDEGTQSSQAADQPSAQAASGDSASESGAGEAVMAAKPAEGGETVVQSAPASSSQASSEASGEAASQPAANQTAANGTAAGETTSAEQPATASERMAAKPEQEEPKQEVASTEAAGEVKQAEPIRTGANVIIRRGDNLWRISRRMLGEGVKYTIIYEANRDQIRDPHWIYPGQVFDIPGAK